MRGVRGRRCGIVAAVRAKSVPFLVALGAAAGEAVAQPAQVSLDLGGVPLELTLIPAGSFREGSPPEEAARRDDEGPRDVTLTRAYYLGVVPVTRGQFARFVAETSYRTESETGRSGGFGLEGGALVQRPSFNWRAPGFAQDDTHPAALLTFTDAERFLAWASQRTGRPLRLPTEAEWERACRAGTSTAWYTGDTIELGRAAGWFNEGTPVGTRPVRGRLPNAYGLFDMVGHVQQWVDDWYAPLGTEAVTDPHAVTPDPSLTPSRRVLRGGSWLRPVAKGRCAARERATPGSRNADTGLRVAMDGSAGDAPTPPPPPPPPPPPAPVPDLPSQPDASQGSSGGLGLGAIFAIGAAVFAALFAVGRSLKKRTQTAPDDGHRPGGGAVGHQDVQVSAAPDGFRVFAPPHRAGQRAHVEYRVQGRQMTKWVVLDPAPSGQFVYTGAAPEAVVLIAVAVATRGGSGGRHGHGGGHGSGHHDSHFGGHTDSHFGGHNDSHFGGHGGHDDPAPMPVYQGPPSAY